MRTVQSKKHEKTKGRSALAPESKISQFFYRLAGRFPFSPSHLRYSITLSDHNRFIWFRIPKVATNTIHDHLKSQNVHLDAEYAFRVNYPPLRYTSYFKFGFIRNPWERIVSCWLNKVVSYNHFRFDDATYKAVQSFDSFIDFVATLDIENCDGHLKSQSSSIDLNHVDFIGRLEQFDADFLHVCDCIGIDGRQVVPKNQAPDKKDFREYYHGDLKDKVFNIYEKDIRTFGYEF